MTTRSYFRALVTVCGGPNSSFSLTFACGGTKNSGRRYPSIGFHARFCARRGSLSHQSTSPCVGHVCGMFHFPLSSPSHASAGPAGLRGLASWAVTIVVTSIEGPEDLGAHIFGLRVFSVTKLTGGHSGEHLTPVRSWACENGPPIAETVDWQELPCLAGRPSSAPTTHLQALPRRTPIPSDKTKVSQNSCVSENLRGSPPPGDLLTTAVCRSSHMLSLVTTAGPCSILWGFVVGWPVGRGRLLVTVTASAPSRRTAIISPSASLAARLLCLCKSFH